MSNLVGELLQVNFIPLVALIFLLIFLKINDAYEHEVSVLFYPVIILILLMILTDNMNYYLNEAWDDSILHTLVVFLGYNLRIFILVNLIGIAMRERKIYKNNFLSKARIPVMYIPFGINFVITAMAFFTRYIFWFDGLGKFKRGPLSFTPHCVGLYYCLLLIAFSIYIWKKHHRNNEAFILFLTTLFTIAGTVIETIFDSRGILCGLVSIAITVYYLCIHIEYFRYDILTGVFNRTSFYADLKNVKSRENCVIMSIDLNDLKLINDRYGHLAGDEALKVTSKVIASNLSHKCILYRMGGDEFSVIAQGVCKEEVIFMIDEINAQMKNTDYSCAIGYAFWGKYESFEDVFERADEEMYKNKAKIKGAENIR